MKLAFFLIAFCLVFLRIYFSWSGKEDGNKNHATITISNGIDYEQIKYAGQIKLNDDETTIKSISPGGYLKYRKNDRKLIAESNLEGEISYRLYQDDKQIAPGDGSNEFIAEALKEMIAYGFDAAARMERIYKKGGTTALLNEIDEMRSDNIKAIYLDRLFLADSLSEEDLASMAKKTGSLGADLDKVKFLNRFTADHLKSPQTMLAWFKVVEGIGSDLDKINLLNRLLDKGTITEEGLDKIIGIAEHLGGDMDKENLLKKLIDKGAITGYRFDKVLDITAHIGSDMDKVNMYKKLMQAINITEAQWISILSETAHLSSDFDKSNLLIQVAQKMPESENVRAAYLKAAKTINADSEYGKALKAIE